MAGEYEHIKGKGNRFSSTNQPPNRGRKKSLFRSMVEKWDDNETPKPSKEDYNKMIGYLMERTSDELAVIASDPDTPIWAKTIIKAMQEDVNIGRITTITALFDRVFGKPSQSAEIDAKMSLKGSIPIRAWVEDRLKAKK